MVFRTSYGPKIRPATSSGRPELEILEEVINDDGLLEVKATGLRNMYEITQESCPPDIYTLLRNCGISDNDVVSLKDTKELLEKEVVDFSGAPRTLIEAHQLIHKAQNSFYSLSPEVRAEFNDNPAVMLNSFLDGTISDRLSKFGVTEPGKTEEVKKDE